MAVTTYDFADNYLRTYSYEDPLEYVFLKNPTLVETLTINILLGYQNLSKLVDLIPGIVNLTLNFHDTDQYYDISPLGQLCKLQILHVIKNLNGIPKLTGLRSLANKLRHFTIDDQNLDVKNPEYDWPKTTNDSIWKSSKSNNDKYKHIRSIKNYGSITVYNIKLSDEVSKILNIKHIDTDNILIQVVNCDYFVFYHTYDLCNSDDMKVLPINKHIFSKIMNIYGNPQQKETLETFDKYQLYNKWSDDDWYDTSDIYESRDIYDRSPRLNRNTRYNHSNWYDKKTSRRDDTDWYETNHWLDNKNKHKNDLKDDYPLTSDDLYYYNNEA